MSDYEDHVLAAIAAAVLGDAHRRQHLMAALDGLIGFDELLSNLAPATPDDVPPKGRNTQ